MTRRRQLPVSLIAACSLNRAIGRGGALPWLLPCDWAFFATATRAQVLVLGRRSFQELTAPLANRHTIVVSRSLAALASPSRDPPTTQRWDERVAFVSSLDEALALANTHPQYAAVQRVFVGGGERLYGEALDRQLVESCYVTRVHRRVEDADAFLPTWTTVCPTLTYAASAGAKGSRCVCVT